MSDHDRWIPFLERIAKTAHNSFMADDWDDIPQNSIVKAAWRQTALDVVMEMQAITTELGLGSSVKETPENE